MLSQAIGNLLPIAVAVALSPIPIIAIIVMLGTKDARRNGPAFAAGWVLGLSAVSLIVLFVLGGASTPDSAASTTVNWGQVGLGLLFFGMARRQWAKRPAKGEAAEMPAWLETVDHIGPGKAFSLGIALSAVNPKNLALTAAAAASIAQVGLSDQQELVAVAVFVVIGSLTVAGPVLFTLLAPQKSVKPLAVMQEFMAHNSAVIMMVILVLIGAKMLGSGLGGAFA